MVHLASTFPTPSLLPPDITMPNIEMERGVLEQPALLSHPWKVEGQPNLPTQVAGGFPASSGPLPANPCKV